MRVSNEAFYWWLTTDLNLKHLDFSSKIPNDILAEISATFNLNSELIIVNKESIPANYQNTQTLKAVPASILPGEISNQQSSIKIKRDYGTIVFKRDFQNNSETLVSLEKDSHILKALNLKFCYPNSDDEKIISSKKKNFFGFRSFP